MDIFILVLAWLVSGMIGSVLVAEFYYRRGSYPVSIDVGDIIFFSFMSLFGPLNFIAGLFYFAWWLISIPFKLLNIDTDKVIFKARDK